MYHPIKVTSFILCAAIEAILAMACHHGKNAPGSENLTATVDPFIGTDIGNTLPGAQVPFGMVRLGPDVAPPNNTTGYRADQPIRGFSHNHVSGTGGGARYGNILVIPQLGGKQLDPKPSKYNEYAKPGYYTVTLSGKEGDVQCELTTSAHAGMHRYTFFKYEKQDTLNNLLLNYKAADTIHAHILIDAGAIINMVAAEATQSTGGEVDVVSNNRIEGRGDFKGGWGGENPYHVYFSAEFDRPFASGGTWKDNIFRTVKKQTGANIGAYADFILKQRGQVQLKVGISYESLKNARNNMHEISDWNFNGLRMQADSTWNSYLNSIHIEGCTPEEKTVFYTALYHTFVMPTGLGNESPGWHSNTPHYTDYYTLWDTYRTVMPLHTLIRPDRQAEIVQSLIDIYEHRGWFPDAWTAGNFAMVQGGTSVDVVIADAMVKGLKGIDFNKAYAGLKKNADIISDQPYQYGRYLAEYEKLGYVSADVKNGSSRTLEYAYDDFCVAQVARALGKKNDYEKYLKRSYNSFNLFNPDTRFFWAKDPAGAWMPGFSPNFRIPDYWNGPYFYEGTPWNYSTYFPQDMGFLISKHHGNKNFVTFLDQLFDGEHYEMGNEPGFLTPYLYNYAGRPDKTAQRIRTLLNDFKVGRTGLPGQDDSGAMSAWYIFGALGFYPVAGQNVYLIGSPLFAKSTIDLKSGKYLIIMAKNVSPKNKYVQSATLNGKRWNKCWFAHDDIKNGAQLILQMGDHPSSWGRNDPPPSASAH